jgi:integrase
LKIGCAFLKPIKIKDKTWRIFVSNKITGKRESKCFSTRQLCLDWADKRKKELEQESIYGIQQRLKVADVITAYIDRFQPAGRTKRFDMAKLLKREIAQLDVAKLTAKYLIEHTINRNAECKPQTAQNDLIWLKQALVTMRTILDYQFDASIFDSAREILRREHLIAKPEQRERRPTKAEIWALARHFKGHWMLHVMYFAIYSARRVSETTRIEMADINHDKRTVILRNLKDPRQKNKTVILKLPKPAYKIIMRQGITEGRIFPYHEKTISKYFTDACKVLGIEDLHYHDLRHEAASRLFEQGLAIQEVAQITGHSTWATLKRYTNLDPGDLEI